MKERKEWRPLPDSITVKDSKIEGLGVFATQNIPPNTDLGISHVYDERFPDNYIRLPFGAFINHHEMPNCKAVVAYKHESIGNIKHIRIISNKHILKGEELTLNYIINKLDNPLWEFEYEVSQ
tara:strand:+ start:785 stop:1153 length:369 start_codon:yes stop_codon:yes gene_type:complete